MKFLTLLLFSLVFSIVQSYAQDWKPYNDTLVYFYQASNTGDYFTLRTKTKVVAGEETKIHFTDNYIPCDTTVYPGGHPLYYAQNGSILGDSMIIVLDTLWLDNTVKFVNNMTLGETLPYSTFDESDITYIGSGDTLLFEMLDSVKYYNISDGSQLIQSKNFGIIHYPKPHSDSTIYYELVGIENSIGLNFDHHNEIFNFEIGDKFYYSISYYSVFYDLWGGGYSDMEVLDKYLIDGRYYYDVKTGGGTFENFPYNMYDNPPYDYPGERVQYCRACETMGGTVYDLIMEENDEYERSIGQRYRISPETGNTIQVVGYGNILDSYTTLTSVGKTYSNLNYQFYPSDQDDLYINGNWDGYETIYEAGYGIVWFDATIFEDGFSRILIGAIKSGDTVGVINSGIYEEQLIQFNVYPNPATELIHFDQTLSSIAIFDISGKQVLFVENLTNQMDISGLEAGTYIIHGTTQTGKRSVGRFVKS